MHNRSRSTDTSNSYGEYGSDEHVAYIAAVHVFIGEHVNNTETRRLACACAEEVGEHISLMDLESAIPYLRKCFENCSPEELDSVSQVRAAALWARGAIGAQKWRTRRG